MDQKDYENKHDAHSRIWLEVLSLKNANFNPWYTFSILWRSTSGLYGPGCGRDS